MIRRLVILGSAGVLTAGVAYLVPAASSAGTCAPSTNPTPAAGDTLVPLPDGGQVFVGGDQSTATGEAGIEGPHGYLEAQGSATSGGGTVTGSNPDSGLNGSVTLPPSGASSICISPS